MLYVFVSINVVKSNNIKTMLFRTKNGNVQYTFLYHNKIIETADLITVLSTNVIQVSLEAQRTQLILFCDDKSRYM